MSYDSIVESTNGGIDSARSSTLIVGLGNPILGDDGVGWRVASRLRDVTTNVDIECLSLGGLSLMEHLIGYDLVIVIDTIQTRTGSIGQVYTFPLEELPDLSSAHTTAAHDTSLLTALKLGREMGARLPEKVIVVAVEAARIYDFSEELSTEVANAVPKAILAVRNLLPAERSDGSESACLPK